ncbi:hypothetical protein M413DRAFT_9385 [Hebeloma cylindrosporum]|uniref:Uncharacterized protein n=1 Tax=Hebeloma cylindrosporum TaxID=76867 RepID=A0A0C3CKA7_HEBCY|nr:hypothetical protein M413DRAFT_9385 [Hebeloma cylindrosporum h7]
MVFKDVIVDEMDMEIEDLENIIDRMALFRARLAGTRNQRILISHLPNEVMAEIFQFCLATSPPANATPPVATTVPFILGAVCKSWRDLAWCLPQLWDTFHCRLSMKKAPIQATLLKEWLSRTNGHLLSIVISVQDRENWEVDCPNIPTECMETLVQYCRRWKKISLTLPQAWHDQLSLVQGNLPNLQSLVLCPPGRCVFELMEMFSEAPALTELHLGYYYLRNVVFPWRQLLSVTLASPSIDEALELLRRCPLLRSCHFLNLAPPEDYFDVEPVMHTALQDLTVMIRDAEEEEEEEDEDEPLEDKALVQLLLELLVLPGLRNLTVSTYPSENPMPAIESLVHRSPGCQLQKVVVTGPRFFEDYMIEFVKNHPSVKEFNNQK